MLSKSIINALIIIAIVTTSCRDKIDIEAINSNEKLVVIEGNINNATGPYYVYLSYASTDNIDVESRLVKNPISNANVNIVNITSGNIISFVEKTGEVGTYFSSETSTIKGEVNNEYYLEVEILGKIYQSNIEKIEEAAPIDSVYIDFNEISRKVEVYVDFTDPASSKDAYIWNWNGFKQVRTNLPDGMGGGLGGGNTGGAVDCCSFCFIPFTGNEISVFEDSRQNGQKVSRQKITEFFVVKKNEFLIEVQQHRLGEEAFNFWNLISLQQQSEGGLFDPPPFGILGNMRNINDDNEEVLGYFYASGVSENYIQFIGYEYALTDLFFENLQDDCRLLPKADTLKPKNWIR